jgi:hypothetical protein
MACQKPKQIHRAVVNKMTNSVFATSKTSFRTNLKGVNNAYLRGNNFWFDAAQYGHDENQNLHVDFRWRDDRYFLVENIGYTNGGASWSRVTITKYGSDEVVYSDSYHNGSGAWQTGDGADARCEYSELTNYVLKILSSYVE